MNTEYLGALLLLLLYLGCMLTQIAVFCWYGNEVMFKVSYMKHYVFYLKN